MAKERQPCVYILASRFNGTLYVGVTSNLIGRVLQHRQGAFAGYTRRYSITRLVYFELFERMDAAIAREKQLKRYRRDWKRNLIERENPAWNDLAVGFGVEPLSTRPSLLVDPSEFTNEVQHLRQVVPCRIIASYRSRNGVRLPGFAKPGNRYGK